MRWAWRRQTGWSSPQLSIGIGMKRLEFGLSGSSNGRMPGMVQAGTYSAVLHYLKAMQAAGTADGKAVADKIRELPVDDFFAKGRVREDGRMMHDMYLVEVKTPSESKAKWDYYKVLRRIPAEEAAQPLSESKCSLVKK